MVESDYGRKGRSGISILYLSNFYNFNKVLSATISTADVEKRVTGVEKYH